MKTDILKHLTVTGFSDSKDLTDCEILENDLKKKKRKLKQAKNDVKTAKKKLNIALEKVFIKLENEKTEIKESHKNSDKNDESASGVNIENLKLKQKETIEELDSKKDKIKKKIVEYNVNGNEKWDSFKQKLSHDLEELGKAFKSFVTKAE
jgi:vacuolar-type H+-ATPase subunit I/STV1